MRELPQPIASLAFRASNGELAWRPSDIENALLAIRDSQQAILGGEIWMINVATTIVGKEVRLVNRPGSWCGLIPPRIGGIDAVWSWDTESRATSESWQDYCNRTCVESIDAIRSLVIEQEFRQDVIDSLRFNVTYTDETGK
jgi:hypothetical protein